MSEAVKCDNCDSIIDPIGDRHWRLERRGPLLMEDRPEPLDFCDRRCLAPWVERLMTSSWDGAA